MGELEIDTGSPPGGAARLPPVRGAKALVHRWLDETPASAGPRLVQMAIMLVILVSVAGIIIETLPVDAGGKQVPLAERYPRAFRTLELVCVAIFTAEFLLRLWSAPADPRFAGPRGRLRFAMTPMALVDLLAILPTYLEEAGLIAAAGGFVAARALRLVRIFRLFKLAHYSESMSIISRVLVAKRAELSITLFVAAILLVLGSTLVYYAEYDAQPDKFTSIPAAMWWAIVTLTTVGYGDIFPVTPMGKVVAGVLMVLGIGFIALPAGILGSAFMQELSAPPAPAEPAPPPPDPAPAGSPRRCPHCGNELTG